MRLFDAPDYWTRPLATVQASDVALSKAAGEALAKARESHDRNCAAAIEFAVFDRIDRLAEAVERWREFHRTVCNKDREDCTCRSVLANLRKTGLLADLVDESMPWAELTEAEFDRQVAWMMTAVCGVIKARSPLHISAKKANHGVPHPSPARLLITPLTSAPGAPPAQLEPQLTEGFRAA